MVDFNNIKIAFASKSKHDLRNAQFLFSVIQYPALVNFLGRLCNFFLYIHFPIAWIIKPTLYRHFVGGDSMDACVPAAKALAEYGLCSLLDYSVESATNEQEVETAFAEIMKSIHHAAQHTFHPFTVFKPTALLVPDVLKKQSAAQPLDKAEQQRLAAFIARVDALCVAAANSGKPILVDAEDYCYQKAIDEVVLDMMKKYNKGKAIIFNTFQMYRTDRLSYLHKVIKQAEEESFIVGAKLVRGAYMEKERERAKEGGYESPIRPSKNNTDEAFNAAVEKCVMHINHLWLFCGTHNEESIQRLILLMEQHQLSKHDSHIFFSQLYGMSDNISFNLAEGGYNVAKYMPYGEVKNVLPYLLRRARENTSVAGQTGRELSLLNKEIARRKSIKKP